MNIETQDKADTDTKALITVLSAALLFATASDRTDNSLQEAFDSAERFTEEAVRRYG